MHDDLGRKNQTTRYILPRHWLYEWFSQFHRYGTYLVLSRSPTVVCSIWNVCSVCVTCSCWPSWYVSLTMMCPAFSWLAWLVSEMRCNISRLRFGRLRRTRTLQTGVICRQIWASNCSRYASTQKLTRCLVAELRSLAETQSCRASNFAENTVK